jgi:hypothetical protein
MHIFVSTLYEVQYGSGIIISVQYPVNANLYPSMHDKQVNVF